MAKGKGLFPDYEPILDEFDSMISWKQVGGQKVPEPKSGLDEEFDACNNAVDKVKQQLEDYLGDIKKVTGCKDAKLCQNSKKYRFEIEVSAKTPLEDDDFVLTTKLKDKLRYQSEPMRDLIEELERREEELKGALAPFLRGMFRRFYNFKQVFQNACSCVSELDCLVSLAQVSDSNDLSRKMCRPKVLAPV